MGIESEMGVVVQKMVPSETAGVLFTCHPSTQDVSQMVITANFGLGEVRSKYLRRLFSYAFPALFRQLFRVKLIQILLFCLVAGRGISQ